MIPEPLDPALLREHAFQDTGDLKIVLDPATFTEEGGFKPILKYGLGYFNYGLGLSKEVHQRSFFYMARSHMITHFNIYGSVLLLVVILWAITLFSGKGVFRSSLPRWKSTSKKENDVYYVKV